MGNGMRCQICDGETTGMTGYGRLFHRCGSCGHVFTMEYNETALSRGMGMEGSWSGPGGGGYREYCIVMILRQLFGMERFLLFGTGNTPTLARLLSEGVDVVGSDISQDVVDYKQSVHGRDRFYRPDALPGDLRFDGIVAVEVIEHFSKPLESFRILFGHLAASGIVAGTTNFYPGGPVEDENTPGYMSPKGHVAYWSLSSLARIAATHGKAVTAFEMVRPGSVVPDERFGQLWPNKRVFFLHDREAQQRIFSELHADLDTLDINMP